MKQLSVWFVPAIVNFLTRLIAYTCHIHVVTLEGCDALVENKPDQKGRVYAFWHGRLLLCAWYLRRKQVHALVSQSRDGEYIARVLGSWGIS